jgi:hypothetical protein
VDRLHSRFRLGDPLRRERILAPWTPSEADEALLDLNDRLEEIKSVAFGPGSSWVVLHGRNGFWVQGIAEEADSTLADLNDHNEEVKDVAFTPDGGWVVIYGSNGFIRSGLPQGVEDALTELHDDNKEIKQVAFAPDGSWVDPVRQQRLLAQRASVEEAARSCWWS